MQGSAAAMMPLPPLGSLQLSSQLLVRRLHSLQRCLQRRRSCHHALPLLLHLPFLPLSSCSWGCLWALINQQVADGGQSLCR